MDNPFRYGRIATGEFFIGREHELASLEADVRAGQDVAIISPRQFGKTSLIHQAIKDLRQQKYPVAYVDLFKTPTKEQLVKALMTSITEGLVDHKGRVWEKVRELFGKVSLHPTAKISPEGNITVELGAGERTQDIDSMLERLLSLPQKVAEDRKQRVLLALDEFQQITAIDKNLPAILRAEFQTQQDVVHLFAGSRRHVMERLFTSENEPLFRMAKIMRLGPIAIDAFCRYIHQRFTATEQQITDDAVARILEITGGHPSQTQELAHFVWNIAANEQVVATPELVDRVLAEEVVEAEDARYTMTWSRLSANQKLVLTALATTGGTNAVYSESYRRAHGLGASSTVQNSIGALVKDELVKRTNAGEYQVADPFLRAWIAREIAIGAELPI